ncbi:MAG: aldo/keto reductase [Pseudomonadota bacterium]
MSDTSSLVTLSGQPTSGLCFGCMQFGGTASQTDSRAMFDACREAGLNFFDTAHVYTDGQSEEMLGHFAAQDRDALLLATKVAYTGGSGRDNILGQFEDCRRRLDLETVDVLYLHRWDPDTALDESFDALSQLQETGQVRYIGVSNFAAWQVMKAQAVAARFGTRIDIIQPMYSLVKRQAEVELFSMALSENIAVASYSPLGGGLLTGKYHAGHTGRLTTDSRYAARYGQDWMHQAANAFAQMAKDKGYHPATLAVAWAAAHDAVTAPIISARNLDQLAPSLAAQDLVLSTDDYQAIAALTPQPAPATDRLEEG